LTPIAVWHTPPALRNDRDLFADQDRAAVGVDTKI
jgi:hypothetical protein